MKRLTKGLPLNQGTLDRNGFPLDPKRIFVGIRRINMPGRTQLLRLMDHCQDLVVPVRFLSKWEMLRGQITKIDSFPAGSVVHIRTTPGFSVLERWGDAQIWVPNRGQIGVLIN